MSPSPRNSSRSRPSSAHAAAPPKLTPSEFSGYLESAVQRAGMEVTAQAALPPRDAVYDELPSGLDAAVAACVRSVATSGVYRHQVRALADFLAGADVCLATSTASGKSLVFMAACAHALRTNADARVLALYPARALIYDQLDKWQAFLKPLGIEVAFVDGSVPVPMRTAILQQARVLLMTPDVAHAWLMGKLEQPEVRHFVEALRVVVLDEAHVYSGAFGTNMAYLMRRLEAQSGPYRLVASTATIGAPRDFLARLTGRTPIVIGEDESGAARAEKHIWLLHPPPLRGFSEAQSLLRELTRWGGKRFLAFADSRRMVEQLVGSVGRTPAPGVGAESGDEAEPAVNAPGLGGAILPYRAGYEEQDRKAIQDALTNGTLSGVVCTSALELGLDIGDIDLVILLDSPPTVQSFWQRMGRAGRRSDGYCLIIDAKRTVSAVADGLDGYLRREVESSMLYLDNPFLQYAHALCAAHEVQAGGDEHREHPAYATLPPRFLDMLANELDPQRPVDEELFVLKQRAQGGPHLAFPLRSGIEPSFEIKQWRAAGERSLGTVTYSQMMREAYPGAIYYYLATPYRVTRVNAGDGKVEVKREKRWTTDPSRQNMVFPSAGVADADGWRFREGLVFEANVQVSERVLGFTEHRGPNRIAHQYGKGSPYAQRPLHRLYQTTGVGWYFTNKALVATSVGDLLLAAFCAVCSVERRDVGLGLLSVKSSSLWPGEWRGLCIYDATPGSLRLTRPLRERWHEVLAFAERLAMESGAPAETSAIGILRASSEDGVSLRHERVRDASATLDPSMAAGDGWTRILKRGTTAVLLEGGVSREVQVLDFRYTPAGDLMYQIASERKGNTLLVRGSLLRAIPETSEEMEVNLGTLEERDIGGSSGT